MDLATTIDELWEAGALDAEPVEEDEAGIEPIDEEDLRRPIEELKAIVEAMIFASPEPLTPKALQKLLDSEPKEDVLEAIEAGERALANPDAPLRQPVAGE